MCSFRTPAEILKTSYKTSQHQRGKEEHGGEGETERIYIQAMVHFVFPNRPHFSFCSLIKKANAHNQANFPAHFLFIPAANQINPPGCLLLVCTKLQLLPLSTAQVIYSSSPKQQLFYFLSNELSPSLCFGNSVSTDKVNQPQTLYHPVEIRFSSITNILGAFI